MADSVDWLSAATPTEGVAAPLHRQLRESLRASLSSVVAIVSRATTADVRLIDDGLHALNLARGFHPDLYAAHWLLVSAVRSHDRRGALNALQVLSTALRTPYSSPGVSLSQFNGCASDAAVLEFLLGPEGARGDCGEVPDMRPLSESRFIELSISANAALETIAECDPGLADELGEYVAILRPFAGAVVRGVTSMRAFGLVYLREPDPHEREDEVLYFVDHITHEVSHLHLHALMNLDPLILNSDAERFPAPIRRDPRPLYGIYHATFVLSRIVRVLRNWNRMRGGALNDAVDQAIARYQQGYRTVLKHGSLTPAGRDVLASTHSAAGL